MKVVMALVSLMAATPALALDRFEGVCTGLDAGNARISDLVDRSLAAETYGAEYCALDRQIYRISRQIVAKGPRYSHCSHYRRAKRYKEIWEGVTRSNCAERGH